MQTTEQTVRLYEDLAYVYDRQGQAKLRDWFLVLAADTAFLAGWEDEAERLRVQLLSYNPHHLLKPFTSFAEAVKSSDIQSYIADLKHSYPPERAEELLHSQKSAAHSMASSEAKAESSKPAGNGNRGGSLFPERPAGFQFQNQKQSAEPKPLVPSSRPAPPPPRQPMPKRPAKPPQPVGSPVSSPASPPTPSKKSMPKKPSSLGVGRSEKSAPSPSKRNELSAHSSLGEDENTTVSQWVSGILFGLVGLIGLALAVYTLARQFIPDEWLL